jgi:hypothetical protein
MGTCIGRPQKGMEVGTLLACILVQSNSFFILLLLQRQGAKKISQSTSGTLLLCIHPNRKIETLFSEPFLVCFASRIFRLHTCLPCCIPPCSRRGREQGYLELSPFPSDRDSCMISAAEPPLQGGKQLDGCSVENSCKAS